MPPSWSSSLPGTASPISPSPPPAGSAAMSPATVICSTCFEFQRAATDLLGAEITLYSDGALRNEHVSPDLATATPL